jgi:hypothetical protein
VASTSGLSVSELQEIGAKIGAKLDSIGLPGMSAELSSKESSTRTKSKEQSHTTTFFAQTSDCSGLTHARYQLIEKFTFEYTEANWFGKRSRKVYPVESELNVFDETSLEYVLPGCCKDRDQDVAELQKKGYVVLVMAKDGSAAAVLPAKPIGEGVFKLPGARGSFQVGDEVPSRIITQWLRLSGESRERWWKAKPRLERYRGSMEEVDSTKSTDVDEQRGGAGINSLMLGLCVGGALGLLFTGLRMKKKLEERRVQREPLPQEYVQTSQPPKRNFEMWEHRTETQEGTTYSSE